MIISTVNWKRNHDSRQDTNTFEKLTCSHILTCTEVSITVLECDIVKDIAPEVVPDGSFPSIVTPDVPQLLIIPFTKAQLPPLLSFWIVLNDGIGFERLLCESQGNER
jgi:hypothetical protein